jgi:hypothetical protein
LMGIEREVREELEGDSPRRKTGSFATDEHRLTQMVEGEWGA